MKTIFVEARYKKKVSIPKGAIEKMPKRVALLTTVQFIGSLDKIRSQLESAGKKVILPSLKHCIYAGQVLGCSIAQMKGIDAFLYIGDGLFHPTALSIKNDKPVFTFNPFTKKLLLLDSDNTLKKKIKGALLKFYTSKKIGILVSTKSGQKNLDGASRLQKRFPEKEFYVLVSDTLDFSQLENFPFIECFVNTACPRIAFDDSDKFRKSVVNIGDIT